MDTRSYKRVVMTVSAVTMAINLFLAAFKLAAGLLAGSPVLISDAVHTLSDVISTVVVMIGGAAAAKKADATHPYGHERMEYVAATVLAFLLAATGFGIGGAAVVSLAGGGHAIGNFSGTAVAAAAVGIAVKEGMYHYTAHYARKIDSGALLADAWHHRSDALSSVGSLAGVLCASFGYPLVDPIAALAIALLIVRTAVKLFVDACRKLEDRACDDSVNARLTTIASSVRGVERVDMVKTRQFGNRFYADLEIGVSGSMSTELSHRIATEVHDRIEREIPGVKHCMVHVNPVAGVAPERKSE